MFSMKKTVFAVLAMLVLVGNVCAATDDDCGSYGDRLFISFSYIPCRYILDKSGENLNYENFKKLYNAYSLDDFAFSLTINYSDIETQYEAAMRLSTLDARITALDNLRKKLVNGCSSRNDAVCAEIKEKNSLYQKQMSKLDAEWNKYKNEPARRKKELAEQEKRNAERKAEEEKRKAESPFFEVMGKTEVINDFLERKRPKKSEFETNEAFQTRLNSFYNDSTDIIFKKFALTITEEIVKYVVKSGVYLNLGNYDAEKGVFYAKAGFSQEIGEEQCGTRCLDLEESEIESSDYYCKESSISIGSSIWGKIKVNVGELKISPEEAQKLKQGNWTLTKKIREIYISYHLLIRGVIAVMQILYCRQRK